MPTRLRDSSDADFLSLKDTKNNHLIRYNSSNDSFDLVSIDSILGIASEDGNLSENFVDIVQQEILGTMTLDGGIF